METQLIAFTSPPAKDAKLAFSETNSVDKNLT